MVCEGITTLVMPIARWRRRFDALLAIKGIDVSVVGPVNLIHLKIIKDLYGGDVQDISKFELMITGAGTGDADGTWTISASTAPTKIWSDLEKIIGMVMQRAETVPAYKTWIYFTSAGFNGVLLASGGKLYVMTASFNELNGWTPNDSNCWGSDDSNCMNPAEYQYHLPTTIIINVQYILSPGFENKTIYEAGAFYPFDNTKTVVQKALGAVTVNGLLDKIQLRPVNQSILEALRGGIKFDLYVRKRSNKNWKIVKRTGDVASLGEALPLEGETANTLEKLRRMLDRNDMQRYHPQRQELSAAERFAMLKTIAVGLDDVLSGLSGNDFEPALPSSFIEGFNGLTTSLNGEKPEVYSPPEWSARLESYRQRFGVFADIINDYATGLFSKLHATRRATLLAECGFLPSDVAVTGTGNGTGNTPADLQAAADVLSGLAVIKGQLDFASFTGQDLLQEGRELRYAYGTGRVRFNGKKRTLTIVKVKESGKQTTYVAHFVDNKNVLNPSLDRAWWNPHLFKNSETNPIF